MADYRACQLCESFFCDPRNHVGQRKPLDVVLSEVAEWGMQQFPKSTDHAKTKHLMMEAMELVETPGSGEEMADVVMIVAHLAAAHRVDLTAEIERKLAICRRRQWRPPDADGVIEHVR